uniref:PPM-type phosphatase domain-containing protein n=1 Tax=Hirondellea gigas TaxID=1518452 RepID=A0A6A7G5I0_9CRUS
MGILPSALNSKSLSRNGCDFVRVGTASMQGCRIHQEDAHRVVLNLPNHPAYAFYGVFDGHGGGEASKFVQKHLIHRLDELDEFTDEKLKDCFRTLDRKFVADENSAIREHGTTCVCCLVERIPAEEKGDQFNITCVNLGDSRSLLLRNDDSWIPLSEDHKPTNDIERERILQAKGSVQSARVDGNLAVSRAFGDWSLKCNADLEPDEQKVSCIPDITRAKSRYGDILFLSCDGIYEHLSNAQVVNIIRQNYDLEHPDPAKTLTELFESSLDSGSTDNMTGVLAHFIDGSDYQWGDQYVPGPLYQNQGDSAFLDAYLKDAEGHIDSQEFLRLIAYHQDLKEMPDSKNHNLKMRIKQLDPLSLSIEDFSTLNNALHSAIIIKPAHIESLKGLGITNASKAVSYFDDNEDATWRDIGISEFAETHMRALLSVWTDLPDEMLPELPSVPLARPMDDSDSDSSDDDLTFAPMSSTPTASVEVVVNGEMVPAENVNVDKGEQDDEDGINPTERREAEADDLPSSDVDI